MSSCASLVGDGIENPGNALAMVHAAEMYGAECLFRDTKGLAESESLLQALGERFPCTAGEEIRVAHSRIIAFDNLPGAAEVYSFNPGTCPAILVGNERRGLSHGFRELATDVVQVPMVSRRINCLNVAARRGNPASRRPELLLGGGGGHVELGSAIRSAAAFGWERAFIDDRQQVWFGCDRVSTSEGRAAARRGRNAIRLVPCPSGSTRGFQWVTVVTRSRSGRPLHKANLARGGRQLVVISDESMDDATAEDWTGLGQDVQFAQLDLPVDDFTYHFRLTATVAMAEVSRQVGRRLPGVRKPGRRAPVYDRALELTAETSGEVLQLEDLLEY